VKFKLRPILAEIKELYHQPISNDRFAHYLKKLQGDSKDDLALPIAGFNPMAKDHVLLKIEELESINAEELITDTINRFNEDLEDTGDEVFLVVPNIADDLKGAWTNFYTTDFDSKFNNSKPKTLEDHLSQEIYISSNVSRELVDFKQEEFLEIEKFYHLHKHKQDYDIIFNFFYGDKASESIGYKKHGIEGVTAYDYAGFLAR